MSGTDFTPIRPRQLPSNEEIPPLQTKQRIAELRLHTKALFNSLQRTQDLPTQMRLMQDLKKDITEFRELSKQLAEASKAPRIFATVRNFFSQRPINAIEKQMSAYEHSAEKIIGQYITKHVISAVLTANREQLQKLQETVQELVTEKNKVLFQPLLDTISDALDKKDAVLTTLSQLPRQFKGKKIPQKTLETIQRLASTTKEPDQAEHVFQAAIVLQHTPLQQRQYEEQCLDLLQGFYSAQVLSTKKQPTSEELKTIEQFLVYATKNDDLNKRLKAKSPRNDAEDFIFAFSYKTQSLEKIVDGLKPLESTILESLKPLQKAMSKVTSSNETLIENIGTLIEGIGQLQIEFDELEKEEYNPQTLEALQKQLVAVQESLQAIRFVPPNSVDTLEQWLSDVKEQVAKADNLYKSLGITLDITVTGFFKNMGIEKSVTKVTENIEKVSKTLSDLSPEKKITLENLQAIYQASSLGSLMHEITSVLPELKSHPPILNCAKIAVQGVKIHDTLTPLLQNTTSYNSGDVLFDHIEKKKPITKERRFTSWKSLKDPAFWKEVRAIIFEGKGNRIFAIQPMFTGPLSHAAIANVKDSTIVQGEIEQRFQNFPLRFLQSVYTIAYTPNIEKCLTDDAKKLVSEDDFKKLSYKLQKQISTLLEQHYTALQQIKQSPKKAAKSTIPEISSTETRALPPISGAPVVSPLPIFEEGASITEKEQFCSEFVAHVLMEAFTALDKELKAEYKAQNPDKLAPASFFHDVTQGISPKKLHPNRLADVISRFYDEKPRPPILDALIEEPKIPK